MKKILFAFAALATIFAGCTKDIDERLTSLERRVDALEEYVTTLNSQVQGIQTIVANLEKKVYVTGVETLKNDSGAEIGYRLTFNQGNPIEIKHGNTGAQGLIGPNGQTPSIDMAEDGNWYWRYAGGDWLLDGDGNKIPVYKSLEFNIDEGHLYVSVDGSTPIDLGVVKGADGDKGDKGETGPQGDSWFEDVTVDEEAGTVTISIAGSEHDLVLPFNAAAADEFALNLQLPESTDVLLGGTIELSYTIAGCPADAAAVFVQTPEDWTAVLDETNRKITLTVGEKSGRVVVYAINNETGEIKAKFVNYDPSDMVVLGITEDKYYFTPKGGTFTIPVSTGINYDIQYSAWLEVTKKVVTKGVQHTELVVEAKENATSNSRTGDLTLMTREGEPLFTMNFEQKNYLPALIFDENGDPVKWQETFDLKVGETTTAKKNDITIELSDDFSKGTYLIKNMFIADEFYDEDGRRVSNEGANYYADEENGVLTVYRGSQKSYSFDSDIALAIDLSAMTLTGPAIIDCYNYNRTKSMQILDYKIAVKSEAGSDNPLAGTWKESFSYSDWSGTTNYTNDQVLIEIGADGSATISNMFRTMMYSTAYSGTYTGTVSSDGRSISIPEESYGPNTHGMLGPVPAMTLTLSADNQTLVCSAVPSGVTNYTLTR